jgi:signal peptidase II
MSPKARTFWPLLLILVLADCTTKDIAVDQLSTHVPHLVLDSFVRFTLVYNPNMAFGIDPTVILGPLARPALICIIVTILLVMLRMYHRIAPRARVIAAGLALACGGAIGNLLDRLRSPLGVVDFIDVGVGSHRFWVFNVADAGVMAGTVILAITFLREDINASGLSDPAP